MEEPEDEKTDVGLNPNGRWGWGHQQGRGVKRGWRRLRPRQVAEQMAKDERRLRKRYLKG